LIGIPTVPFNASDGAAYHISAVKSIIVDRTYASWADKSGDTLIPPSLYDFASIFADDLRGIWGLDIRVSVASGAQPNSIFLTIEEKPSYWYASGETSAEGYAFNVTSSGIAIHGASPLGVWWATRSLLQQSIISDGKVTLGKAVDFPGWKIRGMMLDAARHYYPPKVS
jgi:hexosaminidase